MIDKIECNMHGERDKAFVCTHLSESSIALGFNYDGGSESLYPDAWCDNCEIIRAAHDGWTDDAESLAKISLICSSCYERTRVRNTRPAVALEDLSPLRWKCGTCDEWHIGPCLDLGFDKPYYWDGENESSYLNEDFCAIEDRNFFVRGLIRLPIIGTDQTFNWGVWGSLSRENFHLLVEINDEESRTDLPPMFSWLSTQISDYPDTLSLKMHAHIQKPGVRPHFYFEESDHPLAVEQHNGILPERIREITLNRFGNS
jgi:hypothetical protein